MKIIKRNGSEAVFNRDKIHAAVEKANAAVDEQEIEADEIGLYDISMDTNFSIDEKPPLKAAVKYAEELSERCGLPIWMHTAEASVARGLSGLNVLPMTLQKKFFDIQG